MRIRLETTDRLPFWIIGDPARPEREVTDGVASDSQSLQDSVQITRNQQSLTGAEWETRLVFDRGNSGVVYEATGHRIFQDEWAVLDFLQTLTPTDPDDELHRWSGDVWLRSVQAGSTFREWLLPEAVVALTGTRREGAAGLYLTYRITAAGFDPAATRQGTEAVALLAPGSDPRSTVMRFFGTATGGSIADGAQTFPVLPLSGDLSPGSDITLRFSDSMADPPVIVQRQFQVVEPGSLADPGFIPVSYPLAVLLEGVASAFALESQLSVTSLVAGGRPCLEFVWLPPPANLPEDVFSHCIVNDWTAFTAYEGYTSGVDTAARQAPVVLRDSDAPAATALIQDILD